VVASRQNIPVYLSDVATVAAGSKFRREDASYNGQESVYVTVEKQYGSDTLKAIKNIKEGLNKILRICRAD
jgi:Cu/Ag efflux pump CusA